MWYEKIVEFIFRPYRSALAYTDNIGYPLSERIGRVDQQDNGGGLVVKAKHKKHLLHNILAAKREFENLNKRNGNIFAHLSSAFHLTAPSCSTASAKLLLDTFKINPLSTNAKMICFAP